jgi:hypothetical protein
MKWDGGSTGLNAATGRTSLGLGTIATQNANNVSITGGSITGITDLAIADGGTGASTATAAFNNLAPSQTGNSGKFLTTDGTNASWGTAVAITFPFYKSSGTLDTIALVSNSYLPFYNYSGTAKNIALTT